MGVYTSCAVALLIVGNRKRPNDRLFNKRSAKRPG